MEAQGHYRQLSYIFSRNSRLVLTMFMLVSAAPYHACTTPWIRRAQTKAQKYLPPLPTGSQLEARHWIHVEGNCRRKLCQFGESETGTRRSRRATHYNQYQNQDLTADGIYVICSTHCSALAMQGCSGFTSCLGP